MKKLLVSLLLLYASTSGAYRLSEGVIAIDSKIQKELTTLIKSEFGSDQQIFVSAYNLRILIYGYVSNNNVKSEVSSFTKQNSNLWPNQNLYRSLNLLTVAAKVSPPDSTIDDQILKDIKSRLPNNLLPFTIKITVFDRGVYLQGIVTKSEGDEISRIASQIPQVKQVYKIFDLITESDAQKSDSFGIK